MTVGSRRRATWQERSPPTPRRDRCSMTVGSRPRLPAVVLRLYRRSRSMLDSCGIETTRPPALGLSWIRRDRCSMAVVSRPPTQAWRLPGAGGRDRCSMTVGSRQRKARRRRRFQRAGRDRCSMTVGSRLALAMPITWEESASRSMLDDCGIETTTTSRCSGVRGLGRDRWLDVCGIETLSTSERQMLVSLSRSMLDGCGIETRSGRGASRRSE